MEITKPLKYRMELKFNLDESTLDDSIRLSNVRIYRIAYGSIYKNGIRLAKKLNKQVYKSAPRLNQIQFNPDTKDWNIQYDNLTTK